MLAVGAFAIQRLGDGQVEHRAERSFRFGGVIECADGYVELLTLEQRQWDGLVKLMGDPEWAQDPELIYQTASALPIIGLGKRTLLGPRIAIPQPRLVGGKRLFNPVDEHPRCRSRYLKRITVPDHNITAPSEIGRASCRERVLLLV